MAKIDVYVSTTNSQLPPVTTDFILDNLPLILACESTLAAFLPLSADPHIQTKDILKLLSPNINVEIVLAGDGTHSLSPSERRVYVPHYFAENIDSDQQHISQAEETKQHYFGLNDIWKDKYLVLGCIFHQLGHYVYDKLKSVRKHAPTMQIGNRTLRIVPLMTSLVENVAVPIKKTYEQAKAEQEARDTKPHQPTSIIAAMLDPGQVVELGIFGFVADFWAKSRGIVPTSLFRHIDDFDGLDLSPIDSRLVFKKMLENMPIIKKAKREDLQYTGELEIPFDKSSYRRVGFGVLSLTHPGVFYSITNPEEEEQDLKRPHLPPGYQF
jgi:hypothetical protein